MSQQNSIPQQKKKQKKQKMYWQDALRLARQTEAEGSTSRQRQQWTNASRQAEEDMEGAKRGNPEAVVWLPEEVAQVIRQAEQEDNPEPSPTRPQPKLLLTTLLAGIAVLLLPVAISYLRAYRKITAHFSL